MDNQPHWYWHQTGYDIATGSKAERKKLALLDRRALLSAQDRDFVVITSGDTKDVRDGVKFLHDLGVGPHPDRVMYRLDDVPKDQSVRPYTGAAKKQRELQKQYGLQLKAPEFEICRAANDKGTLQRLQNNDPVCDAHVPKGYLVSRDGVEDAVRRLLALGTKVRVKVVNSASGIGQVVIGPDDPIVAPRALDTDESEVDAFVVQQEVVHEFDASVQFFVTQKTGAVNAEIVTGQHIEDGRRHVGNFFPWDLHAPSRRRTALADKMKMVAEVVVNHLVKEWKYFGYGSVDFVGSVEGDTVSAIEVNARVTAAFYPIMASRRWYGKVIPFDMRSFKVKKGTSWRNLKYAFGRVLFDRDKQFGFVPFCLLPEQGVCFGVCYAPTVEKLLPLIKQVEEAKLSLAERRPAR